MSLHVRLLASRDTEDFIHLIKVFEQAFGMERFPLPDTAYLQNLLQKPDFRVFVAQKDLEVVGGLTVYLLDQYYVPKPLAYIYDLAVLPAYQRQGIGKTLIRHLIAYCRQEGIEEAFVQAESDDEEALCFYRSTPVRDEMPVSVFTYHVDPSAIPPA